MTSHDSKDVTEVSLLDQSEGKLEQMFMSLLQYQSVTTNLQGRLITFSDTRAFSMLRLTNDIVN